MINYKSLTQKENNSILKKTKYIENHSEAILQLFSENIKYSAQFLEYLICDYQAEFLPDEILEKNTPDYYRSLEVIFYICNFINCSNFKAEQKEAYRNKIRDYLKYLKEPKKIDRIKGNQFVKLKLQN